MPKLPFLSEVLQPLTDIIAYIEKLYSAFKGCVSIKIRSAIKLA